MRFKDYSIMVDILEDFDTVIDRYESLNENNLGDLDVAKVIEQGLDKIPLPSVKAVMGAIGVMAKKSGAKASDIMRLFSKEGFGKVKEFIKSNILGSEEILYLKRKYEDGRYKGYQGLEQFIADMAEDNPKLLDSLKLAARKLLA